MKFFGWLVFACFALSRMSYAEVLYSNGFENGSLQDGWKTGKTKQGQALITSAFAPIEGSNQLLLHDTKKDETFSVAEAILKLDLRFRKNVVLKFQAKSLGNTAHLPPSGVFGKSIRDFDAVCISRDNGKSWKAIQALGGLSNSWQSFSISLDAAVAQLGGYTENCLIRFSAFAKEPSPNDGIAIDEVQVSGDREPNQAALTLPMSLLEGGKPAKGRVTLSQPSAGPLIIHLKSNDPASPLVMPAQVTMPAKKTSVEFHLSASSNGAPEAYRTYTVTASGEGVVPAVSNIGVSDNVPIALSLFVPSMVAEGLLPINNAELRLNRPLANNTTVNLTTAPAGQVSVPATLTIPAGSLSIPFTVAASYDAMEDGTASVQITAAAKGVISATGSITVMDSSPPGIAFVSVPVSITEGDSAKLAIKIGGVLIAPTEVVLQASADLELNFPARVTVPAGVDIIEVPFSSQENSRPQEVRAGTITATAWGFMTASSSISIIDDDSPREYNPALVDGVNTVGLPAVSMAADDQRGLLWLALSSRASPGMERRLVTLNPLTGLTEVVLDLRGEPGQMKISKNGRYLYIALEDRPEVQRIDLTTRVLDLTIPLGLGLGGWEAFAWDFEVLDGDGTSIVATLHSPYLSVSYLGVAVFDGAVRRPYIGDMFTFVGVIEPTSDPSVFFGYDNESTGGTLTRLQIEPNGVAIGDDKNGYISLSIPQDIRTEGDSIFTTDGRQIDGEQFELVNRNEVRGLVLPQLSSSRILYLEFEVEVSWVFRRISVFEPVTFTKIASVEVPESQYPTNLIRWGSNGLAYLSEYGVHVLRTSKLLPQGQPGDVAISAAAATSSPRVSQPLQYQVKVSNHGTQTTTSTVAIELHHGQTFQSATPQSGSYFRVGEKIVFLPGALAPGGTSTLTLTVIPTAAGAVALTAGITSDSPDQALANNWVQLQTEIGFLPPSGDSVTTLLLAANDIVEDPVRDLLWISVGATEWSTKRNSIVSVDPSTGVISSPILLAAEPAVLAISANGNYLYVGFADSPEIQRIHLPTRMPDLVIPLGMDPVSQNPLFAEDIDVLTGDGTGILVSRMKKDLSPRHAGVAVYDGAVMRSLTTPGHTGPNRIEPTQDPKRFVGMTNASSPLSMAALQIDGAGVSQTMFPQTGFSFSDKELGSSDGLLLTSSGILMDAVSFDKVGDILTESVLLDAGFPLLEAGRGRAYVVQHLELSAYSTNPPSLIDVFPLPVPEDGYHWNQDWAKQVVRWGQDGFAIVDPMGKIYLARWSLAPRK